MTSRSFRMLSLACFMVLALLVATLSATVPSKQDRDTSISKQQNAVPHAVVQQQVPTIEGKLMGQIPIITKNAFDVAVVLPDAPVSGIDHVPLI